MIFITNKYTNWYCSIIAKAITRSLPSNIYIERHHIIPKSLGGVDSNDNLVELTAREHFVCHWLLTKMTENSSKSKMVYALLNMRCRNQYQQKYETKITSRVYENSRLEYSKLLTGVPKSATHRANISSGKKGKRTGIDPWNKGKTGLQEAWNKGKSCPNLSAAKKGSKNPRARTYKLTDPDGIIYIVTGELRKFCQTHCLNQDRIIDVAKNRSVSHKNWFAEYVL